LGLAERCRIVCVGCAHLKDEKDREGDDGQKPHAVIVFDQWARGKPSLVQR
jgi:hypothetical protein